MELLIKNVRVVDFAHDFQGDVYIYKGKIFEIGKCLEKDCQVLDGKGKTLMPAFVDLHAHFRDPGFTYKEDIATGSKAAVRGGYTTVNLMGNTKPVCSSMDTFNYVMDKVQNVGIIDAHQVVSITRNLEGKDISHLDTLTKKVKFISDDGKGVADNKIILDAMVKAKEKNLRIISHAESPELTNVDMRMAENMMTWRDIAFAKFTGCKLHMAHVSTKEAMIDIIKAKKEGHDITCEVTPHHIALTDEEKYRVNPPMRGKEDVEFLIKAMRCGYVDCIATDHAPHSEEDKKNGAPGISGLETSFSVCYSTLVKEYGIDLKKLSWMMSKRPAEIMGVNKGQITVGYDADLVLVDLNAEYEIKADEFESKGKNTPFNGKKVFGKVLLTLKEGRTVYVGGEE